VILTPRYRFCHPGKAIAMRQSSSRIHQEGTKAQRLNELRALVVNLLAGLAVVRVEA
jgi:hypothetical protein